MKARTGKKGKVQGRQQGGRDVPRLRRCFWASPKAPQDYQDGGIMALYHDQEWGVPSHDDRHLFEHLALEIFQAGLSWLTVLKKRENFQRAFANFEPKKVAGFGEKDVARLLRDEGIIRNQLKIRSTINNARAVLGVQREFGSLAAFVWRFAAPCGRKPPSEKNFPTQSCESEALSRALKERGFKFVGPTGCYAFMQSVGLVNDHLAYCFRRRQLV